MKSLRINLSGAEFRQGIVSLCSSVAFICVGLARAWASTAIPSMTTGQCDMSDCEPPETCDNNCTNPYRMTLPSGQPLSEEVISWVLATLPMGAMVGSLISVVLLKYLGRKYTIITSGVLFFIAFLCIGLSNIFNSHVMLLLFRVMTGCACGISIPAVSIYIAETVSPVYRGTLGCLPALLHAAGILACYILGAYLPWFMVSYLCCIPACILVVTMLMLPESPVHLVTSVSDDNAAVDSVRWLKAVNQEEARKETEEMINKVKNQNQDKSTSAWGNFLDSITLFLKPSTLKPFLTCLVLQFVQQWCGVHVIVFKTVNVFQTFNTSVDHNLSTIIVGAVAFAATFLSLALIERAGRRILLIISSLIVSLSMGALALYYTFLDNISESYRWLPLLIIIISFIGFSVGLATIPLSLIGELLPARSKNILGPLTSFFNLLFLFLVLKNYVAIAQNIEYSGIYWLFSAVSLFGAIFVILFLPETKGKTLEDIEKYYS